MPFMSPDAPAPGRPAAACRRWFFAFLSALLLLSFAEARPEADEAPARNPLSYEEDDGVKRLLGEAEELEKAGRWREALGRYQRALARNADHLCPLKEARGAPRYVGTAEYIALRVAAYPPEGLAAYRAEYDAAAQGLIEAWARDGRTEHLETIVTDYFFSTLGDEAAHLLAERLFCAGRVAEAERLWDRLLRLYPSPGISPVLVAARLLMARRLLGEETEDGAVRARLAGPPVRFAGTLLSGAALSEALDRASLSLRPPASSAPAGLPVARVDEDGLPLQWLDRPDRPRTRPEDPRLLANDLRLSDPMPLFEKEGTLTAEDLEQRQQAALFAASLPADARNRLASPFWSATARDEEGRDAVIVQNGRRIVAFDPGNGRILWRNPPGGRTGDRAATHLLGGAILACVADGRRVYANLMLPSDSDREPPQAGFAVRWDRMPEGPRTICCYDIPTGRLLWDAFGSGRAGAAGPAEARRDSPLQFLSPVVPAGDRVFAAGLVRQNDHEVYVCAFRADSGALLWKRYLASAPRGGTGWRNVLDIGSRVPCVAESAGVVFCLTNIGAVAALDGADGRVLWMTRYPAEADDSEPSREAVRPVNLPVVSGAHLVVLPQDAARAFRFDARTGALAEAFGNAVETPFLVGVHPVGLVPRRAVFLAGRQLTCHFLEGASRDPGLSQPPEPVVARGAFAGGVLYLPLKSGLLRYDMATLKIVDTAPRPWVEESDAGHVTFAGDLLVVTGREQVATYAELGRFSAGEVALSPPHPPSLLAHGRRLFASRRFAEATDVLLRALALLETGAPADDSRLDAGRETLCRSAFGHVEALVAAGDRRRLPEALETLRRVNPHARRPDLQANLLLLASRTHLALGPAVGADGSQAVTEAVGAAQEVIERVPEALVVAMPADGDPAVRRARARHIASERVADLIATRGRGVYRAVEDRAAAALSDALQRLPRQEAGAPPPPAVDAALAAVIERFPHSDAAWDAARRRAALAAAGPAGRAGASSALAHYLDTACPDPGRRAEALLALAAVAEPEAARRALVAAARIAPDAAVPAEVPGAAPRTVRDAVADRLAAIAPPVLPRLPAVTLDLAPGRHREETVSGHRLCFPDPTALVTPPPIEPGSLLLARGSALILWSLDAQERVWTAPCPKGDVGFELIDDPAAGTRDGVFKYPGPAGKAADDAGLKDRDVIVRIDGRPVGPDETRQALAGARPGLPLRLDVRRGDRILSTTLIPGPWPEDREPQVRPDLAAWIPGGALAVAWKDRVAAVTPGRGAEGLAHWVFPPSGDPRIRVEALFASRRCVFVRYRPIDAAQEGEADEPEPVQRPVVIGGRVFVRGGRSARLDGSHRGPRHETRLAGLEASTGRLLWERVYPPGVFIDTRIGELVLPAEDLLARALVQVGAAGSEEGEERTDGIHRVEVIDGWTGRRIGPGAADSGGAPVRMALDRDDGWLAYLRGASELQVFDLFARALRETPIQLSRRPPAQSSRDGSPPPLVLEAAHGRIAVAHDAGTIEIADAVGEAPPRELRLAELLGNGAARRIDPRVPGALRWIAPDRLVVYSQFRQDGYLSLLDVGAAPKVLWETVETRHASGDANREEAESPTEIPPPMSRYLLKHDRSEGVLRCFDRRREGAFAREIRLEPAGGGREPRGDAVVRVDGERLLVETRGAIRIFRP